MYLSESESATDCMATNGTLLIRKLPVGDYYFVESVTPSGYMPYGKKVEFTISADNENTLNMSLTVADNKSVLSQTGGGGIAPFYFVAVALGAMAIIFIYDYHKHGSKKYKKSRRTIKNEKENHTNYDSYGTCRYDGIYCNSVCKCRTNNNALDETKKVSITLNCSKPGYTFTVYKVAELKTTENPYKTGYDSLIPSISDEILSGKTSNVLSALDGLSSIPSTASTVGTFTTSATSVKKTFSSLAQGLYYIKATNYPAGVKSVTNSVVSLPYYNNGWVYSVNDIDLATKVNDGDVVTGKTITNSTKDMLILPM